MAAELILASETEQDIYSLKVKNLPKAPAKPGQQGLGLDVAERDRGR